MTTHEALNIALKTETRCKDCKRKLIGYTSIEFRNNCITRICKCGASNNYNYWGYGSIVKDPDSIDDTLYLFTMHRSKKDWVYDYGYSDGLDGEPRLVSVISSERVMVFGDMESYHIKFKLQGSDKVDVSHYPWAFVKYTPKNIKNWRTYIKKDIVFKESKAEVERMGRQIKRLEIKPTLKETHKGKSEYN